MSKMTLTQVEKLLRQGKIYRLVRAETRIASAWYEEDGHHHITWASGYYPGDERGEITGYETHVTYYDGVTESIEHLYEIVCSCEGVEELGKALDELAASHRNHPDYRWKPNNTRFCFL